MIPPPKYKRIALHSTIQDEDGYISNVPLCLCEHCKVNQFLCTKYKNQQSEPKFTNDCTCNKYTTCEECLKHYNNQILNWDSKHMIGNVSERFKQLERKQWDWSSFYNGWLEGRAAMYAELRIKGDGQDKILTSGSGGGNRVYDEYIAELRQTKQR